MTHDTSPEPSRKKRDRRYWFRLVRFFVITLLIVVLAIYYVVVPLIVAYSHTHPGHHTLEHSPADYGLAYQDMTLTTADGVTLSGWYIPPQNGVAILLMHGIGSSRDYLVKHAPYLTEAGYGSLLIDLRGHGESGGEVYPFGQQMALEDVYAALDFLAAQPEVEQIGALGFSLGGMLAIQAAARDDRIRAVIADGPASATLSDMCCQAWYDYLNVPGWALYLAAMKHFADDDSPALSVRDSLRDLPPRPLFLIAGGNDRMEVRHVKSYYHDAGDPVEFWEVPGAGHIGGYGRYPDEYSARVIAFFEAAFFDQ